MFCCCQDNFYKIKKHQSINYLQSDIPGATEGLCQF